MFLYSSLYWSENLVQTSRRKFPGLSLVLLSSNLTPQSKSDSANSLVTVDKTSVSQRFCTDDSLDWKSILNSPPYLFFMSSHFGSIVFSNSEKAFILFSSPSTMWVCIFSVVSSKKKFLISRCLMFFQARLNETTSSNQATLLTLFS